MSAQDEITDEFTRELVSLSEEELSQRIANFFDTVGASPSCPVCTNRGWQVAIAGKLRPAMMMMADGADPFPVPHVPLVGLVCGNCGFTRMHLRQKVLGG